MITYVKQKSYDNDSIYIEIACESSDTKPTDGIATGSVAYEVDTGYIYMFSEKTSAWVKQ